MKIFIKFTICFSCFIATVNHLKTSSIRRIVKSDVAANVIAKTGTGISTIGTTGDVGNT